MAIATIPGSTAGIPNSKTTVSESTPAIPTSKTTVSEAAVAIPTSKTTVSEVSAAIPTSKTTVSEASAGIPTSKTTVSAAAVAIPTAKTTITAAAIPRTLTPLVDMHFDSEQYSQNGNPVTFANLFTYTRASTGTYIGRDIVNNKAVYTLKTAAIDELRIEYDAATGEKLGALPEGPSTNLAVRSEEFDNASWTKTGATISVDAITGPDGILSADKLIESSSNEDHRVRMGGIANTSTAVLSVFAKAGERTELLIREQDETSQQVIFNLLDGTVVSTANSPDSVSIIPAGGGWFRCSIGVTTSTTVGMDMRASIGGSSTYLGDGSSGLFIFGAQVESLAVATSYIKTEGSTVTRAADNLTLPTLNNVPSSLSSGSVHIVMNIASLPSGGAGIVRHAYQSDQLSPALITRIQTDGDLSAFWGSGEKVVRADGLYSSSINLVNVFDSSVNTITSYLDGVQEIQLDAGNAFSPDTSGELFIGQSTSSSAQLYGHIKKFAIYDEALTAQEVALL